MHNFYGIQNKVTTFKKGLLFDRYDEPTYLTFSIDFRFDEDSIFGDILWKSPLFANPLSSNSARRYLGSTGHKDKEQQLKTFNEILQYLTFNAPWYFQSINGLGSMWANGTDIKNGKKSVDLTIDTLEAIDLRITELASLYRTAVYDKVHLRQRIPDNLLWFSMDIYVAEFRNIRYTVGGNTGAVADLFGINTGGINTIATQLANSGAGFNSDLDISSSLKQFGYVKFKCRQCTFDFSESFAGGNVSSGNVMNVAGVTTPAKNTFKIKVGFFEEESEYQDGTKLYDDAQLSEINNPWSYRNTNADVANGINSASNLPLVGGAIQKAEQGVQRSLESIGGLINPSLAAAARFINPEIMDLGNIYGR